MANSSLQGLKIYPYRVLFLVEPVAGKDEPCKWACVDLRTGRARDVYEGHLRCLLRHQAEASPDAK